MYLQNTYAGGQLEMCC